jgi:hypothetical protein
MLERPLAVVLRGSRRAPQLSPLSPEEMRGAVRTAAVPGKATAARADWSSAGRPEISDNLGGSPSSGNRATRLPEATDDDLMSWVKTLGTPAQVEHGI